MFFPPKLTLLTAAHAHASYTRPSSSSLLLDLDDPNSTNSGLLNRYALTRLFDVFLVRQLAALPLGEGVVVNTANRGLCKSRLRRNAPSVIESLFNAIAWKTETGAKCVSIHRVFSFAWTLDPPQPRVAGQDSTDATCALCRSPSPRPRRRPRARTST